MENNTKAILYVIMAVFFIIASIFTFHPLPIIMMVVCLIAAGYYLTKLPDLPVELQAENNANKDYHVSRWRYAQLENTNAICDNCGKKLKPTAKFCGSCGNQV